MQGLFKEIFDLERCWMRDDENNRWLFAAMGMVVQMHQYRAWQEGRFHLGHQIRGARSVGSRAAEKYSCGGTRKMLRNHAVDAGFRE